MQISAMIIISFRATLLDNKAVSEKGKRENESHTFYFDFKVDFVITTYCLYQLNGAIYHNDNHVLS